MASRMDRYYKTELISRQRSSKNRNLYDEIDSLDNYSNIEGIADIQTSNEIDISKVKEMLKSSDNHRNKYEGILKSQDKMYGNTNDEKEELKTYDINNVLSKVRDNNSNSKYRSLDNEQYEALKSSKNNSVLFDISKEEKELKELIHTLYASKTQIQDKLNNVSIEPDNDVGLLDDLKSNTMVGDASSIKSIIDEEKKNTVEEKNEIDNSFYTKSFGFTSSDFEELKDINHKIKNSNKYIIILLVILIVSIIAVTLAVFMPKFINFYF